MIRLAVLHLFGTLLVLFPTNVARAADIVDANQAVTLLGGALQAVKSFDVKVEVTQRILFDTELSGTVEDLKSGKIKRITPVRRTRRDSPLVERYSFRQVFQGNKGRVEFLSGPGGNDPWYAVDDGEVEKSWNPKLAEGSLRVCPIRVHQAAFR